MASQQQAHKTGGGAAKREVKEAKKARRGRNLATRAGENRTRAKGQSSGG